MTIDIRVPSSTANIGSGVDCMGIALGLYLSVHASAAETDEFVFRRGFSCDIPREDNLFLFSADRLFDAAGETAPKMRIEMDTEIPCARGLGSSAAAIAAGLCYANACMGDPFSMDELIKHANAIEGHPDNVVPCLVGGFTVCAVDGERVYYEKSRLDDELKFVVAVPEFELSTKLARSVIPAQLPLNVAVSQLQRACLLSHALCRRDYSALAFASEDMIFTPPRRSLIPAFDEVRTRAVNAGAICAMISGAGPSIAAICTENENEVANSMTEGFAQADIESYALILTADNAGAMVGLSEE